MPSWVECTRNPKHYTRCIDAAREMADGKLGDCKCGGKRHYIVEQTYPYDPKTKGKITKRYEVEKVYRRFSSDKAEYEGWDPMFFRMRDKAGEVVLWPQYWIKNEKGKWHYGQFPPLLTINGLEDVMNKLR